MAHPPGLQPRDRGSARHHPHRLPHRLSFLPPGRGRHGAGGARADLVAAQLFPASAVVRLHLRPALLRLHLQHGERAVLQHQTAAHPHELHRVGPEALSRGEFRYHAGAEHIAHHGVQCRLQGTRHAGPVYLVAHQEPQSGRGLQPHGQALFGPCGLLQQPHRAAGERRCRGHLGHCRHHVPDAFGRPHETGRRRGPEHLPQQRLLRHAVLRHPPAADDRPRLLDGRAYGRLHRPLVPVQFVEQGLYRRAGRLHRRSRPPRRERQLRACGPQLLRRLVHQPRTVARLALRAGHLQPLFRAGAALGPQRRGRHDRCGCGDRSPYLFAVRYGRLSLGPPPQDEQDLLLRLRFGRRQNQEVCRLGCQHPVLPVGIQRRRPRNRRPPGADGVYPPSPADSRRTVFGQPPFAILLAGESILEPLHVVRSFEQGE